MKMNMCGRAHRLDCRVYLKHGLLLAGCLLRLDGCWKEAVVRSWVSCCLGWVRNGAHPAWIERHHGAAGLVAGPLLLLISPDFWGCLEVELTSVDCDDRWPILLLEMKPDLDRYCPARDCEGGLLPTDGKLQMIGHRFAFAEKIVDDCLPDEDRFGHALNDRTWLLVRADAAEWWVAWISSNFRSRWVATA
ncbi:hypothetical protein ACLOJK_019160 [Asimina triloba]